MKGDYFVKAEEIFKRREKMVVLDVKLDNFYAFRNFHMNLTYPKKIVGSYIKDEHLLDRPNFRYKKVNILFGANASGKTTFGRILMKIFNFIHRKNYDYITEVICERDKEASFTLDLASQNNVFYRVICSVSPCRENKYSSEDIKVEVRKENIGIRDSYESCVSRIEKTPFVPADNYVNELEKVEGLTWMFEYPRDNQRILLLRNKDEIFRSVLENVLKSLDPSIKEVKISQDVDSAYVIHLQNESIIIQSGIALDTDMLSSGTKSGIEIANMLSLLIQKRKNFYYCDEKFSFIHSDIEKALLSLMIDFVGPNDQLFFTTHNTDILDMNLPKHTFTFLRKDVNNKQLPITCVEASSLLKRSTDSLRNAVENDLFSTAPAVELIYSIADMRDEE